MRRIPQYTVVTGRLQEYTVLFMQTLEGRLLYTERLQKSTVIYGKSLEADCSIQKDLRRNSSEFHRKTQRHQKTLDIDCSKQVDPASRLQYTRRPQRSKQYTERNCTSGLRSRMYYMDKSNVDTQTLTLVVIKSSKFNSSYIQAK